MKTDRRAFLKTAGAASLLGISGCSSFNIASSSIFANGKINMAFIGIGNRGNADFTMFHYFKDLVNVVALCDTDMEGPATLPVLEACPDAPRYTDFRKMFDELGNAIDAVCIATPDFSHFPATMLSMSLGKHVYVEKPLGNLFYEIELMAFRATASTYILRTPIPVRRTGRVPDSRKRKNGSRSFMRISVSPSSPMRDGWRSRTGRPRQSPSPRPSAATSLSSAATA